MKFDLRKGEIDFKEKALNYLDRFAIDFINVLEKFSDYVLVSGYVSIIMGRTRASEDIDLLVNKMDRKKFEKFFIEAEKNGFECLNTSSADEAYSFLEKHAIRFAKKNKPLPNMEFKLANGKIHEEALAAKIKVILKEKILYISPIELQIAYKLSLMAKGSLGEISSDKDFEDAKHLYEIFKDELDYKKLNKYIKEFHIEDKFKVLKDE